MDELDDDHKTLHEVLWDIVDLPPEEVTGAAGDRTIDQVWCGAQQCLGNSYG